MEERKEVDKTAQRRLMLWTLIKISPTTCLLLWENKFSRLTTRPHPDWYCEMHFSHKQCKLFKIRTETSPNPPTHHFISAAQRQGPGEYLPWRVWEKRFSVKGAALTWTSAYDTLFHTDAYCILHTGTCRRTVYQLALVEVQHGWNNKDMFNHTHDKQQWANFPTNNSWVKFKKS